MERDKLEAGQIPGMFFSHGNPEPKEAGYFELPGYTEFFIKDPGSVEEFRSKALEMIDRGFKVVIGYERLGIGGGEGYVTLLAKEPDQDDGSASMKKEVRASEEG